MTNHWLNMGCLTAMITLWGCNPGHKEQALAETTNAQEMSIITIDTFEQILDAFNRHDLDAIMTYFADDCSFDFPRGPEPHGQRWG